MFIERHRRRLGASRQSMTRHHRRRRPAGTGRPMLPPSGQTAHEWGVVLEQLFSFSAKKENIFGWRSMSVSFQSLSMSQFRCFRFLRLRQRLKTFKKIFKSYHIFNKTNLWGTEESKIVLIMMTSHWRVVFVNRQVINFVAKHVLNGDSLLQNLVISAAKSNLHFRAFTVKLYVHVSNKWWMLSSVKICKMVVVVASSFFQK